tara:strand:+ start:84 stop:299 length:216 start_codon:yes stop_codon:yes gene_type:complete
MSKDKDLTDFDNNMLDIDKIVKELNETNKMLFEINKNIASLILVHQVQLIEIEEAMLVAETESNIPKNKLH